MYVSENRNDCGTNKVQQNIKNEVKKQKAPLTIIHSDLMTLQKELKNKDEQEALSLSHDFRRMFGYIQDFSITNNHIKVLLLDEGMIRIYHQIVPKDILYIDCSGYLVLQIHNIARIFNYCITIRQPISKAPALPVFECIASTHTTESVRSMLVHFKSKENFIFGNHAKPKLIVCDFSKVLIKAYLFEFNDETSAEYLARSYKNLVENEETCTYKIVIHLLRAIKVRLHKYYKLDKAKIHFGMTAAVRIIACENLETLVYFLKMVKEMLTTEIITPSITKLMNEIEENLSIFDSIEKILGPIDEESFFENNIEEEENVSENQAAKVKNKGKKPWIEFWKQRLTLDTTDTNTNNECGYNKYFMPDFFAYLNKSLLPQMPYWSNILLEKPTIQANTEKKHNLLVINNANINKTNAVIKNLFKHKKADNSTLNEPIVDYFKRKYQVNAGLKRSFLDKLLKIDNAKLLQDSSMSNRDVATLSSIRETSKSSPLPKMYRKPNVLKEKFKKQNKRSSANSSFLVQPKNKIHFHSFKTIPTLQNKPSQCSRESSVVFSLFKKQFLKEMVLNSPSMKECRKELLR